MVVHIKSAAPATAAVAKAGTFQNLSDFERVGKEIESGVGNYAGLMQTATIAAMQHLDRHGNFNIIRPLWNASKTFSAGEGRKWLNYLTTYTHLAYNPKKLRGAALAEAKYEDLFAKDKRKKMDIAGAQAVSGGWRGHTVIRMSSAAPVNLRKQVATMMKSLNALLEANRLIVPTADGKGILRHASAADVRAELKSQTDEIVAKLKSVPGGNVTSRKPIAAAPKATKAVAPKVQAKQRKAA